MDNDIPGWMSDKELEWLSTRASKLKSGAIYLELGSYCGRSLLAAGLSLTSGSTLISVDVNWDNEDSTNHHLLDTFKMIKAARDQEINLCAMQMSSEKAFDMFKNMSFDMIFIDGSHTYKNVFYDISHWTQRVRSGGIISGHDYCDGWPDVQKVVNRFIPTKSLCDSIWFDTINY